MTNTSGKFIEIKSNPGDSQKNAWFQHCCATKKPYITVTTRTTQADIVWDYIAYPMDVENALSVNEEVITQGLRKIYDKYAGKTSEYSISATTAHISNIPIDDARRAASDIYDFIDGLISQ